jgi:hypothetical protein
MRRDWWLEGSLKILSSWRWILGFSSLTVEGAGLWEKAGVGVPMVVVLLFSGASAWKRRALCWRACRYHR